MTRPGYRQARRDLVARASALSAEGLSVPLIAGWLDITPNRAQALLREADMTSSAFIVLTGDNGQEFHIRASEVAGVQDFGANGSIVYFSGVAEGVNVEDGTLEIMEKIKTAK